MAETKTILVAGATGQQGGAVARSLLQRRHRVKGLTRSSAKIKDLKAIGVEGVEGDLTDKASLRKALRGADGFFIMTTPFKPDFTLDLEGEVRQGTTAIDAAKESGVGHVVLTSVASADKKTGIPHFETKARVEEHLRKSGVPATTVRPVFFMDSFASPWLAPGIKGGTLAFPVRADRKLQMVAVKDIGEVVARAFDRPKEAIGQALELAGDERILSDLAKEFSKVLGRPVRYVEVPEDQARQAMGEDMIKMYQWFDRHGYNVDIPALEKRWGYRMTKIDEFLRQIPWGR